METKVEVLEDNRAKVTVTIDEKTISERIKKQYKQVANQYNIPGFRRGKAPRPVIDSALGKDYVRAVVTDDVVNESYPEAIDAAGIYPVGSPDFHEEDMEFVVDGQPYTFDFEIGVKPTPELSSYDPVEIEMPAEPATEDQIDEEIDALLEHYYEVVPAPANTKVKEDKFVDMKISATDDNGDDIASITSESTQYGLGSGLYPPAFDEQLIGLKKGDAKQFSIDVPTESYAMTSTLAGKTTQVNFDVEILAVKKKKMPELTDDWVMTKIGVESVAALRDELRDEIESQKGSVLPRLKEGRALTALAERLEGDVPEALAEEAESTLLQDFFNQLQRQGMTLDAYLQQQGITSQKFRDDVKLQAIDMTKQDLALDAYVAHEGIEVTDDDIRKEFEDAGAADPEALMADWRRNGQMHLVRQGILRQKAAQDIVDKAIVSEEKPEEAKQSEGKHAKKDGDDEPAEDAQPAEDAE